jgi:hypothetical protein
VKEVLATKREWSAGDKVCSQLAQLLNQGDVFRRLRGKTSTLARTTVEN